MGPQPPQPREQAAGLPVPPWHRAVPPPRVSLTREAIVHAALAVLDEEGLEGLSMRRVAEELGSGVASLYWHVRNKDELLQLVFDRVIEAMTLPEADPLHWKEQLRELSAQMRTVLTSHRDIARISFGRIPSGPLIAYLNEWLFSLLRPLGIPDRAIAYIGDFAGLYVGAYCFEESLGVSSPSGEDLPPEQIVQMFRDYMASLPADQFPHTLSALDLIFEFNPEERFQFGIDLLLRGLESYVGTA
jgi:TetR/AcrR family transcriptional regulator, tetracycline repressor protein